MNFLGISEETLTEDLKALYEIKSKIKTLDELEDLLQTYNMIYDNFELYGNNSLDDIDIKYNIKKLEKRRNKLLSKQITMYLDNDFLNILANNFFNNYYMSSFETTDIMKKRSFNKIKKFILDFYGEIGNLEYEVAKKMFDEKRIDVSYFEEYSGCAMSSTLLGTGYIFVNKNESLNDNLVLILTHEIAHIIESKLQMKHNVIYSTKNINFLTEIISNIYELQMSKYLNKFNKNICDYTSSRMINSALLNFSDLLLYYGYNYKIRNSDLIAYNKTDEKNMFNSILYGFPEYLSLKLLDSGIDIESIKNSIYYLIKNNYNLNYEEIVKIFNLDLDEFIQGNINSKQMKRYLKNT